ncbi:MAG: glycosyltransferase [Candidatus Micrarchaeaceae archaeon]|jgi:glycosyltransferase involved in cell wall biosynthesis
MRVALVNIFKPREGSGDGITEYTLQLYKKLKQKHKIDLVFALDESKRIDIPGRVYVETFFRLAAKKLIEGNYDVVHITNPEIGYFAKKLKKAGVKAKIIVTIHDFVRVVSHSKGGSGGLQTMYDYMVTKNTADAINYADFIIFTSSNELAYGKAHYRLPEHSLIFIGAKDLFLNAPLPRRTDRSGKPFTIGYIGGLVPSRHIDFILKTAEILGPAYRFRIYGTGSERANLLKYKSERHIENAEFMGFAPEKEILKIYDSFDLFMNCSSVDVESLPLEDALARGKPVLISEPNIYDDEVRKRVYQAKTPGHAAEIIKRLKEEGYPVKRQKANLKYEKTVSWAQVARKTEAVYTKVSEGHSNL